MKELDKNIKRKYFLLEYNPDWKIQFSSIKNLLISVFGDKLIAVEHVGSTSIEGMKAKPLIDILIVVEKSELFQEQKDMMVKAGYEWGKDYIGPNTLIFFKLGPDGEKLVNIHMCEKNSEKIPKFVVIRDYLKTHPEKAKEYSDLKEKNFLLHPNDYPAYREAKAPFLKQMEEEAYEWDKSNKIK